LSSSQNAPPARHQQQRNAPASGALRSASDLAQWAGALRSSNRGSIRKQEVCVPPIIVPAYAGVLTLLFVVLSVRVIRQRRSRRVAIGHGGHGDLERMMRVQANFAEYVPLALLLLAFAELQGRPVWLVHTLSVVLVVGRLLHGYGVSQVKENFRLRVVGMTLTFAVLIAAALSALVRSYT
jgi:uncharacterized protein